jgi:tRNA-specific 2-thiouridylase
MTGLSMAINKNNLTVAVAMSGGVDSSVAAALLIKKGFRVIGLTMRLFCYQETDRAKSCCSLDSIDAARQAAAVLSIPHYVIDCQNEFNASVIDYFVNEYRKGRTPNPCVACNHKIKFGLLLEKARVQGCHYLATGHYARIVKRQDRLILSRAKDLKKDQSYFLWMLQQDQLKSCLFPLGGYHKSQVREIASSFGMASAGRVESQEICFINSGHYGEFLRERMNVPSGDIVDINGKILGEHRGIVDYTVGQRGGLGIALGRPQYVISIDPVKNRIMVGDDYDLKRKSLTAQDVNWILTRPRRTMKVLVKIRNQHKGSQAKVEALDGNRASIEFDEQQRAITPGQSAVFYKNDLVLGGGIIM